MFKVRSFSSLCNPNKIKVADRVEAKGLFLRLWVRLNESKYVSLEGKVFSEVLEIVDGLLKGDCWREGLLKINSHYNRYSILFHLKKTSQKVPQGYIKIIYISIASKNGDQNRKFEISVSNLLIELYSLSWSKATQTNLKNLYSTLPTSFRRVDQGYSPSIPLNFPHCVWYNHPIWT